MRAAYVQAGSSGWAWCALLSMPLCVKRVCACAGGLVYLQTLRYHLVRWGTPQTAFGPAKADFSLKLSFPELLSKMRDSFGKPEYYIWQDPVRSCLSGVVLWEKLAKYQVGLVRNAHNDKEPAEDMTIGGPYKCSPAELARKGFIWDPDTRPVLSAEYPC